MAKKTGPNKQAVELKQQIAHSRDYVARDLRGLRYELDIPRKIRRSFRDQTGTWVTAAVVVGALLILLPMRKKKIYVDARTGDKSKEKLAHAGFALAAAKLGASLLKPVILKFVAQKMSGSGASYRPAPKW